MGSNILFIQKQSTTPVTPIIYGALYNWWITQGTGDNSIASIGWNVPTQAQYSVLASYYGGDFNAGGPLKETGFTWWNSPNTGATNISGFNGRGHGERENIYGRFQVMLTLGGYWSRTEYDATQAYHHFLGNNNTRFRSSTPNVKSKGHAIRLVADSTTLLHGEKGTYTDPSGYTYETICINGVEFTAYNIKTKHFRNGTLIPFAGANGVNFTDLEWAALTTGALCAYNNDWNNV